MQVENQFHYFLFGVLLLIWSAAARRRFGPRRLDAALYVPANFDRKIAVIGPLLDL